MTRRTFLMAVPQAELAPVAWKIVHGVVTVYTSLFSVSSTSYLVPRVTSPEHLNEGAGLVVEIGVDVVEPFLDRNVLPYQVVKLLLLLTLARNSQVDFQLPLLHPSQQRFIVRNIAITQHTDKHFLLLTQLVPTNRNAKLCLPRLQLILADPKQRMFALKSTRLI
jgi:hypothetical protein